MIFGHDFKYRIPEMDALLGAAADLGIHFDHDLESIAFPDGRKYLLQNVSADAGGEGSITLQVSSHVVTKREETE
jgi:hypothetical protein